MQLHVMAQSFTVTRNMATLPTAIPFEALLLHLR